MRSFRLISRFLVLLVVGTTITLETGTATAADCKKTIAVTDAGDAASPTSGQLRTAIAELCSGGTILFQQASSSIWPKESSSFLRGRS